MTKPTEDQIIAFMARKLSDLEARDYGLPLERHWERQKEVHMRDCTALWHELRNMVDIKETKDE